ncbi:MAG: hypothetical protein J6O51_00960 [Bacteroidales bacterium]|nr:hypothetical protein [Bacteroidales bacterium]
MTQKGEQIHALWLCLTAVHVVLGKMRREQAEKLAYKEILDKYGEETLIKELEIDKHIE